MVQVCPMLLQLEAGSYQSDEWLSYNQSAEVRDLNHRLEHALPGFMWDDMLDCLMTTACTGTHTLAAGLNPLRSSRHISLVWHD